MSDEDNRQDNWPMGWTLQEIKEHIDALEAQVRELQVIRITVPITEHDVDLFKQLIDDGESFEWTFNNTILRFVKSRW